jgi:hypothetical protein
MAFDSSGPADRQARRMSLPGSATPIAAIKNYTQTSVRASNLAFA